MQDTKVIDQNNALLDLFFTLPLIDLCHKNKTGDLSKPFFHQLGVKRENLEQFLLF